MNEYKRMGLTVAQSLLVIGVVVATATIATKPICIEHLRAEIARAMAAGLLLAVVKSLTEVGRPHLVHQSIGSWCNHWLAVSSRELKCGFVAGYLLGLVIAIIHLGNG